MFSLGAILYALLTLHPPVEASSIREVLERIKRGEIRPPTEYNAPTTKGGTGHSLSGAAADPKRFQPLPHCPGGKVPAALSAVTMRALTVDKARRYATVAEFAADVEKYQGGFATSAEHAGLFTQLRLLVLRHKALFSTAVPAWFIITALAVWFVVNINRERKAAIGERNRAETALTDLANTAPTFAAQATGLVEQGDLEEALEKIGYAVSLNPRNPDFLLQQANLFQATQQLTEAAACYRSVLALRTDAAARLNLELCEKLLRDNAGSTELKRESQGELLAAMIKQGRTLEAVPLSSIVGKESDTGLAAIKAQLKPRLAITGPGAGVHRLPNGTFRLTLLSKPVLELPPLNGLPITEVNFNGTKVSDLTPLKGLRLRWLSIEKTPVTDLSPLAGMPLKVFRANETRITDLSPLRGMPLRFLNLYKTPVSDLSPLAGMPIEELNPSYTKVIDLAVLRTLALKRLIVFVPVKDLRPLADCKALERLSFPKGTADISFLRSLPNLQRINDGGDADRMPTAEQFWQKYDAQKAAEKK